MSYPASVTPALIPAYQAACRQGQVRSRFQLMDSTHRVLRDVSHLAIDGQVDFQPADVSRTLTCGFIDPDQSLGFDSSSPTEGFAGLGVLVQVWQDVLLADVWHPTPMGVFRPSTPTRDGSKITVEAQDKAAWHLRGVEPYVIDKGANRVEAIRTGLVAAGETRLRLPAAGAYLGVTQDKVPVGGDDEDNQPWKVWRRLADQEGLQLFYDGEGYATLRPKPSYATARPSLIFTASHLVESPPTVTTDLTAIRNKVVASGKGKGDTVRVRVPSWSEVSPETMAINATPWENIAFESTGLNKKKNTPWAAQRLTEVSTQSIEHRFDATPAYWLEPDDWCLLDLHSQRQGFTLSTATIPLGAGGPMSVGYNDRRRSRSSGLVGVAA